MGSTKRQRRGAGAWQVISLTTKTELSKTKGPSTSRPLPGELDPPSSCVVSTETKGRRGKGGVGVRREICG